MIITHKGIQYEIQNGQATVCGLADGNEDSVIRIIKKVFLSIPVVKIAEFAFDNKEHLKTVYLPSTIELIERAAFNECSNLSEVRMDDDAEFKTCKIMSQAFFNCKQLTIVAIPKILELDSFVFFGCSNLAYLNGAIIKCAEFAFFGCALLNSILFADNSQIDSKALANSAIKYAVFLGNVCNFDVKDFCSANIEVFCRETSNMADAIFNGLSVQFYNDIVIRDCSISVTPS